MQAGEEIPFAGRAGSGAAGGLPAYPAVSARAEKKKIQGTVHVLSIVEQDGRVKDPKVQKSDNPAFDNAALGRRGNGGASIPAKSAANPYSSACVPITFAL